MIKNIAVTGADGFIGKQLCRNLSEQQFQVKKLTRKVKYLEGVSGIFNLLDIGYSTELFTDIDTVFHLAGKVHALTEIHQDDAEYFQINTEGTRKLLEAAQQADVQRFVF